MNTGLNLISLVLKLVFFINLHQYSNICLPNNWLDQNVRLKDKLLYRVSGLLLPNYCCKKSNKCKNIFIQIGADIVGKNQGTSEMNRWVATRLMQRDKQVRSHLHLQNEEPAINLSNLPARHCTVGGSSSARKEPTQEREEQTNSAGSI